MLLVHIAMGVGRIFFHEVLSEFPDSVLITSEQIEN